MTVVAEERAAADTPTQSRNHLLAVLPLHEFLGARRLLNPVRLAAGTRLRQGQPPHRSGVFPARRRDLGVRANKGFEARGSTAHWRRPWWGSGAVRGRLLDQRRRGPIGGEAERMDAAHLLREASRNPTFRRLLHLYAQGFLTQVAQSTACNRHQPGRGAAGALAPHLPRPRRTRRHSRHPRDHGVQARRAPRDRDGGGH